jgi:hypothetical protein
MHHPGISVDGLRKTTEISQNSWSLCQDLNSGPSKYEEVLSTASVNHPEKLAINNAEYTEQTELVRYKPNRIFLFFLLILQAACGLHIIGCG